MASAQQALAERALAEHGVEVRRNIRHVRIVALGAERSDFDPRIVARYGELVSRIERASCSGEFPALYNDLRASVVSCSSDPDGTLSVVAAPCRYLYLRAFQELVREGKIVPGEWEALSPHMLGSGVYAGVTHGSRSYTWCQLKGRKRGAPVTGSGQAHSAFVGGMVSSDDLCQESPLSVTARREAFEEQGFCFDERELSPDWMLIRELSTGTVGLFRHAQEVSVARVVEGFSRRSAAYGPDCSVGDFEVPAALLVPNEGALERDPSGVFTVRPVSAVVALGSGEVVVADQELLVPVRARPQAVGYFASLALG